MQFQSTIALFALLPMLFAAPNLLARTTPEVTNCPAPLPASTTTVHDVSTTISTQIQTSTVTAPVQTVEVPVPTTIVTTQFSTTTVPAITTTATATVIQSQNCRVVCDAPTTIVAPSGPAPTPTPQPEGSLPEKKSLPVRR